MSKKERKTANTIFFIMNSARKTRNIYIYLNIERVNDIGMK